MSKHTSWQWKVGFSDGSGHGYITDSQDRVVVRGGYDSHGIKHGVVKKIDANLIASAPELLENLIGCMEALASHVPDCVEVQCARAAIAKATGE